MEIADKCLEDMFNLKERMRRNASRGEGGSSTLEEC